MRVMTVVIVGLTAWVESFLFNNESNEGDAYCPSIPGFNSVIDLSKSTPYVNFSRVREDGIKGVIHKATHGTTWRDPRYCQRKKEALKNGLLWGAYHYGTHRPGFIQANHFLRSLGNTKYMLLALDLEDPLRGHEMSLRGAEDFVRTIRRSTGRYPMIYGSEHLVKICQGKKSILFKCPLWIAQYGPQALVPSNTWNNWTMWQYTDGTDGLDPHMVCGVGRCDRDAVNDHLYKSVDYMWYHAGR